jgi:hypothetical protein
MRCLAVAAVFAALAGSASAQECYTYGSLRGCGDRAPARSVPSAVRPSVASSGGTYSSSSQLEASTPLSDGTSGMQFGNTITLPGGQTCATIGPRFVCR